MRRDCVRLCREDADDLEWRDVPVVFLAYQRALNEMRPSWHVVVDDFQAEEYNCQTRMR